MIGKRVLHHTSPVKDYGNDLNNWSVGIRLTYGDNSFVMCGDAENQAEEDIVNSGAMLKADVLKAGHHGSSTSTSDAFLKKVSPSWVVIQCGKGNSYGHPHKETMEKLKKAGCQILRTDVRGPLPHSVTARQLHGVPAAERSAAAIMPAIAPLSQAMLLIQTQAGSTAPTVPLPPR